MEDGYRVMSTRCSVRRLQFVLVAAGAVCACAEVSPPEQAARPVPISKWTAEIYTLPGTYTMLASASEFWDSVVVTTDAAEQLVWRSDVGVGTREPLGSTSAGAL